MQFRSTYRDVDLDDSMYNRTAISRLLRDDEVKDVVGKLKRVYSNKSAGTGPTERRDYNNVLAETRTKVTSATIVCARGDFVVVT